MNILLNKSSFWADNYIQKLIKLDDNEVINRAYHISRYLGLSKTNRYINLQKQILNSDNPYLLFTTLFNASCSINKELALDLLNHRWISKNLKPYEAGTLITNIENIGTSNNIEYKESPLYKSLMKINQIFIV